MKTFLWIFFCWISSSYCYTGDNVFDFKDDGSCKKAGHVKRSCSHTCHTARESGRCVVKAKVKACDCDKHKRSFLETAIFDTKTKERLTKPGKHDLVKEVCGRYYNCAEKCKRKIPKTRRLDKVNCGTWKGYPGKYGQLKMRLRSNPNYSSKKHGTVRKCKKERRGKENKVCRTKCQNKANADTCSVKMSINRCHCCGMGAKLVEELTYDMKTNELVAVEAPGTDMFGRKFGRMCGSCTQTCKNWPGSNEKNVIKSKDKCPKKPISCKKDHMTYAKEYKQNEEDESEEEGYENDEEDGDNDNKKNEDESSEEHIDKYNEEEDNAGNGDENDEEGYDKETSKSESDKKKGNYKKGKGSYDTEEEDDKNEDDEHKKDSASDEEGYNDESTEGNDENDEEGYGENGNDEETRSESNKKKGKNKKGKGSYDTEEEDDKNVVEEYKEDSASDEGGYNNESKEADDEDEELNDNEDDEEEHKDMEQDDEEHEESSASIGDKNDSDNENEEDEEVEGSGEKSNEKKSNGKKDKGKERKVKKGKKRNKNRNYSNEEEK